MGLYLVLVKVSSTFLVIQVISSRGFISSRFRAISSSFYNIRAEHFRAEIRENCSKLLENARIADFERCSKSPKLQQYCYYFR